MGSNDALMSGAPDTVGERIRIRLAVIRMSRAELAAGMRALGWKNWYQETARRAVKGERRITAEELVPLADVLRVRPEDLVPGWPEARAA